MATHSVHGVVTDGIATDPLHGERLVRGVVSDLDLVLAMAGGTRA